MGVCKVGVAAENLVMSFFVELPVVGTVQRAHELAAELVKDPTFQDSIKKAISERSKQLLREQTSPANGSSKNPTVTSSKAGKKQDVDPLIGAIASGFQDVGKRFATTCTTPGIWYDKHKNVLHIIAGAMAVGGAFVMWDLRNDAATSSIEGQSLELYGQKSKRLGSISVSGKAMKFLPSKQETATEITISGQKNWDAVSAEYSVRGIITTEKAKAKGGVTGGSVGVRVKLNDAASVSAGGSVNKSSSKLNGKETIDTKDWFLQFQLKQEELTLSLEYRDSLKNRPEQKRESAILLKVSADF